jgi:hypothetical protein
MAKFMKDFAVAMYLLLGVLRASAQSGNELNQQCLKNNKVSVLVMSKGSGQGGSRFRRVVSFLF